MYDLIDRPVESLCNGGRFLLWATRGWSDAMACGTCPPVALSAGFVGVGALAAMPHFHTAMALLNRDALEKVEIAPMGCKSIAEHEALLATLWRDIALERFDRLRATLALLVAEEAIAPVERAMTATMARLKLAGFDLTTSNPEPQKEDK